MGEEIRTKALEIISCQKKRLCNSKHVIHFLWKKKMVFFVSSSKHTQKHLYICEQVLFVYIFTIILPRLTDPCNFISVLIVTREPEQMTLLF